MVVEDVVEAVVAREVPGAIVDNMIKPEVLVAPVLVGLEEVLEEVPENVVEEVVRYAAEGTVLTELEELWTETVALDLEELNDEVVEVALDTETGTVTR